MRRLFPLALVLVSCATIAPGELDAVSKDFAVLASDVTNAAMTDAPEFKALREKIKAKDYFGSFTAAIALGDKLGQDFPQIEADVVTLRADLRKLFTSDEAASAARIEARTAPVR